jgi:predicted nucleic acid-binding protein
MRVVSNTSPISNLAIIGRLGLLKHRYGIVFCVCKMVNRARQIHLTCQHPTVGPILR